MTRSVLSAAALAVLAIVAFGCFACTMPYVPPPTPPVPVPPVPPTPPPPVPPPTPDPTGVTRATFAGVALEADAASTLAALPSPWRVVNAEDEKTVYIWRLDEDRPTGGKVFWEVHVVGGVVVASFAW